MMCDDEYDQGDTQRVDILEPLRPRCLRCNCRPGQTSESLRSSAGPRLAASESAHRVGPSCCQPKAPLRTVRESFPSYGSSLFKGQFSN